MKSIIIALALTAFAQSAGATSAYVGECEGLDSIGNLMEPVKPYANGEIRVAYITTEEPAAAPDHVLVFVTDKETGMFATCFAISATEERDGFSSVDFSKLRSSYDAKKGLLLTFPVTKYDNETGASKPAGLVMARVNRSEDTPTVTIEN